jgi:hypothetical protein
MSNTQDIINQAILRSQKNQPEWAANYATELRLLMQRTLTLCYQLGHALAPDRFLAGSAVGPSGGLYPNDLLPGPIYRIETAGGALVRVVGVAERTLDIGVGRLYRNFAGVLTSVGGTGDPGATDSLTFWYLHYPDTLTTLTTEFDTYWPTQFDGLLIEEMAIYFAQKDARDDEFAFLKESRDKWVEAYMQYLRELSFGMSRRFVAVGPPVDLQAILGGFLLGGATAKP